MILKTKEHGPPKRRCPTTSVHCIAIHKTETWNVKEFVSSYLNRLTVPWWSWSCLLGLIRSHTMKTYWEAKV